MKALAALLLLTACAPAVSRAVPYELTVCPGPAQAPPALPRLRTVEMLDAHDLQATSALRVTEARRRTCAETLERLVEWVEGR